MDEIRVVLIAPDSVPRIRLGSILRTCDAISEITFAETGYKGSQLIDIERPDLVMIDSELPGLSGMSIAAVVKRDFPETAIVLLTRFADFDSLLASSHCGASTAMCRDAGTETVKRTLDGVLNRQAKLYPWAMFDEELDRSNYGGGLKPDRIDHVLSLQAAMALDCMVIGLNLTEMQSALGLTRYAVRKEIDEIAAALDADGRIPAIVNAIERGWCTLQAESSEVTVISPANAPFVPEVQPEPPRIPYTLFGLQSHQGYASYG